MFSSPPSKQNTDAPNLTLITPLTHPHLPHPSTLTHPIIFLSGPVTYDPLTSVRWQQIIYDSLSSLSSSFTIIDPFNPSWSSAWRESPENIPFKTQVNWELEAMEIVDVMVVCFCGEAVRSGKIGVGGTALMELGGAVERGRKRGDGDGDGDEGGKKQKVMVCVEEGFWKKGYVEVLCGRYGVDCFESLEGLIGGLRGLVG